MRIFPFQNPNIFALIPPKLFNFSATQNLRNRISPVTIKIASRCFLIRSPANFRVFILPRESGTNLKHPPEFRRRKSKLAEVLSTSRSILSRETGASFLLLIARLFPYDFQGHGRAVHSLRHDPIPSKRLISRFFSANAHRTPLLICREILRD